MTESRLTNEYTWLFLCLSISVCRPCNVKISCFAETPNEEQCASVYHTVSVVNFLTFLSWFALWGLFSSVSLICVAQEKYFELTFQWKDASPSIQDRMRELYDTAANFVTACKLKKKKRLRSVFTFKEEQYRSPAQPTTTNRWVISDPVNSFCVSTCLWHT